MGEGLVARCFYNMRFEGPWHQRKRGSLFLPVVVY